MHPKKEFQKLPQMAVPIRLLLGLHTGQTLQNTAVLLRLVSLAALAQGSELLFELR
jgi:hypothetical protein